jgi:hypothetical protein
MIPRLADVQLSVHQQAESSSAAARTLQKLVEVQVGERDAITELMRRIDHLSTALEEESLPRPANSRPVEGDFSSMFSSISFTTTGSYDIQVEGHNIETIIQPLQVMSSRLASTLESVVGSSPMLVTQSNVDWFVSEVKSLLRYAYLSAAASSSSDNFSFQGPFGHVYSLGRKIRTIPIRSTAVSRDASGFMVIEYVEGTDDYGRDVREFRFASFSSDTLGYGSAMTGLFTCTPRLLHEQRPHVARQLRVLRVIPSTSDAFRFARDNDVDKLKNLFKAGLASPFDYDQHGRSLLAVSKFTLSQSTPSKTTTNSTDPMSHEYFQVSATQFHQDMVDFLLLAGADPHIARLGQS